MSLTPEQPFVRLEAVSKSYGSGSSTLNVLDEVELEPLEARRPASSAGRDQGSRPCSH